MVVVVAAGRLWCSVALGVVAGDAFGLGAAIGVALVAYQRSACLA